VHRLAGNQGGPPSNARTGYMTSGLARRRSSLRPAQGLRASPGGNTAGLRARACAQRLGRLAKAGWPPRVRIQVVVPTCMACARCRGLALATFALCSTPVAQRGRWCVLLQWGPFPLWGATKILFAESACAATDRSTIRESHRRTFGDHQMGGRHSALVVFAQKHSCLTHNDCPRHGHRVDESYGSQETNTICG
jgi:hypothetical protein